MAKCTRIRRHYRHYIAIMLLLAIASLAVPYWASIQRLWEVLVELALSFAFYFCEFAHILAGIDNPIMPTVTSTSSAIALDVLLPQDWTSTKALIVDWWLLLGNSQNFAGYSAKASKAIGAVILLLMAVLPLFYLLYILLIRSVVSTNDNPAGHQTKALVRYKKLERRLLKPICSWIGNYAKWLKQHSAYWITAIVLLAVVTNILATALSLLAYMLYLAVSVDMATLYMPVYKAVVDMTYALTCTLPAIVWIVVAVVLLSIICRHIALDKLRKLHDKNKKWLGTLDLIVFMTGEPGAGKTTTITTMALTFAEMFREKAYKGMCANAYKFPNFPWRSFEVALEDAVANKRVTTLYSIEGWVQTCYLCNSQPYGYQISDNKRLHHGSLEVERLQDVLINYAKQYFIYALSQDNIISNYSIRRLSKLRQIGKNMPLWNHDYFTMQMAGLAEEYCHILDFDTLRYGKTIKVANTNNNFEFGVLAITEIGKERGNALENAGKKKVDDYANQKNDLFNHALSFMRHPSTINGVPYVRFLCDDQRPDRWGADARQLTTIMNITKKSEPKLALPWYWLVELVCNPLIEMFNKYYTKYRANRSDDCLPMYLLRNTMSRLYCFNDNIQNKYSYFSDKISATSGLEGRTTKGKFYVSTKMAYSKVFATDCYADFLNRCNKDGVSINDIPTYKDVKPSRTEFLKQHSYVISDLDALSHEKENKEKEKAKK